MLVNDLLWKYYYLHQYDNLTFCCFQQFVVEGTIGSGAIGDIAVDDLAVLDTSCDSVTLQGKESGPFLLWERKFLLDKKTIQVTQTLIPELTLRKQIYNSIMCQLLLLFLLINQWDLSF